MGSQCPRRGWRADVAWDNMTKAAAANHAGRRDELPEHLAERPKPWENLEEYIRAFNSIDMVFKGEALQFLSSFLLWVSPSSHFSCPDQYTFSTHVGDKVLSFKLDDVRRLFELLFAELDNYTNSLFEVFSETSKNSEDQTAFSDKCYRGNPWCYGQLEVAVQVLHCCIRILPLLEFNTSLSHNAAEALELLRCKLCCPSIICNSFSFPDSERIHVFDVNTPTSLTQVACALLEVFMDELLLWPELAEVLQQQEMDSGSDLWFLRRYGKHIDLCMEVAFAHTVISSLGGGHAALTSIPRLSLPAAVALLDVSVIDGLPCMFIAHIGFLVARALDVREGSTWPVDLVLGLASSVLETAVKLYLKFWEVTVPSQSYSDRDRPLNVVFRLLLGKFRHFIPVHVADRYNLEPALDFWSKETQCAWSTGSVPASCQYCHDQVSRISVNSSQTFLNVNKSEYLQELNVRTSEGAVEAFIMTEASRDYIPSGFVLKGENMSEKYYFLPESCPGYASCVSDLLIAILHLISSSLHRMVKEVSEQQSISSLAQHVSYQEGLWIDQHNISSFLDFIKEVFKFSLPRSSTDNCTQMGQKSPANKLLGAGTVIGHALLFFVDRLHFELQNGASEALLKAYLLVLGSLGSLLNLEETKNMNLDANALQTLVEDLQKWPVCQKDVSNLVNHLHETLLGNEAHARDTVVFSKASTPFNSSTLAILKAYKRRCHQALREQSKGPGRSRALLQDSEGNCLVQKPEKATPSNQSETPQVATASDTNTYIEAVSRQDGRNDGNSFIDLKDFVVCKEGRDYSKWLRSRYKLRQKKYHRFYWKRVRDRKELMALLSVSKSIV